MEQEKPGPRYALGIDVCAEPDGSDRTVIAVYDRRDKKFIVLGDAVIQATEPLAVLREIKAQQNK